MIRINLVVIKHDRVVTTSLQVSECFNKRHDNVLKDIRKLDCSEEFSLLNFQERSYTDRGKKYPMYYMTKDGFTFLVMGYRGKKAAQFKEAYILQFNQMQSLLTQKQTKNWQLTRQQGKLTRRSETDTIQQLVDYAKQQGSKNSNKLYMVYSKLANKIVGVTDRDSSTINQLNNLSLVENIILHEIKAGMAQGKPYKEIYKLCKNRLIKFVEIAYLSA